MAARAAAAAATLAATAALALLLAALGTARWTEASARRLSNPRDSAATLSFGLFGGEKRLNPGYGWRHARLSALGGSLPARAWAWLGTGVLLGGAGLCAGAVVVLAALRVFRPARRPAPPRTPLLVVSALAVVLSAGAAGVWATEHGLRLTHNVMTDDELANMWSSEGSARLGLSFWLAVGACACTATSLACACVVRRATPASLPPEKHVAAIMLY